MREITRLSYQERIIRVLMHIQRNLDQPLSLEQLAEVAHFSPFHFHRVFRGMIGEGVHEHLRRLRLERAAHRLLTTRREVTRIAFEAGYQSHEAFTRAFGDMFGRSPKDYRAHKAASYPANLAKGIGWSPDGDLGDFEPIDQGGSAMQVEIKSFEPQRVAFVRHQGPYDQCGAAWEKLCAWAGPLGLLGPDAAFIGLSYDDPDVTPPDKLRYDACVSVGDGVEPGGEVAVQEIAGGRYAVTVHQGPYDKLNATYAQLCGGWMPAKKEEMRSLPCCEVYLNDIATTPPEELLVEIRLPLED